MQMDNCNGRGLLTELQGDTFIYLHLYINVNIYTYTDNTILKCKWVQYLKYLLLYLQLITTNKNAQFTSYNFKNKFYNKNTTFKFANLLIIYTSNMYIE